MGSNNGYKISEQDGAYFLTLQIVGWVDIFSRLIYRDIVIDSWKFCRSNKGLILYAYVIMSNHIHLIAQSRKNNISGFIRDFKSFTSQEFLKIIESGQESRRDWMKMVFQYHAKFKEKQENQIWTHENHPVHLTSQKFIEQKLNYIHDNPVRAGIVENQEDYLYSSARNYAGLTGPIEIDSGLV